MPVCGARNNNMPKINHCPICNKETRNPKYCSLECTHLGRKAKTRKMIEEGIPVNSGSMKEYLYHLHGEKCSWCNQGPIWNGKPLSLHLDHIDGDSDNNHVSNFRILCPNCHSQTETYVARNKKNTKRNNYLRKYKSK